MTSKTDLALSQNESDLASYGQSDSDQLQSGKNMRAAAEASRDFAVMDLRDHRKEKIEDKEFFSGLRGINMSRKEFVRVYAVDQIFTDVVFEQCVFTSCYFRNCRFIRCRFTGATVKDSNFRGAQFEDCKFHYTTWEKTLLEDRFLDSCLPSEGNLARDLVRSLRTNFAQIGDYAAVNKAASIEVKLTGQHLYNAAYSRQAYYRSHYKGRARFIHALEHLRWKALDLLWGNGESIFKVIRSAIAVVLVTSYLYMRDATGLSFRDALFETIGHFWGVQYHTPMPAMYAVFLTATRFVVVGLFMAILIKRLSRR
jgi:uncharacterized protein YjbI with pentapeptide repeats